MSQTIDPVNLSDATEAEFLVSIAEEVLSTEGDRDTGDVARRIADRLQIRGAKQEAARVLKMLSDFEDDLDDEDEDGFIVDFDEEEDDLLDGEDEGE
jgi:hypothetical protein